MHTELSLARLASLVLAVGLLICVLAGSPLTLPGPADKAVHFAAYSLLTLLLWRATEMPLLAVGAALLFGALDEWRQTYLPGRESDAQDFLADLAGTLATGTLLLLQARNPCAESSPR